MGDDDRGHPAASAGDGFTIGAIALLAYALASLIHEGGGHGGACLLVGAKPAELNAIFFRCGSEDLSPAAARIVSAGGSVVNVLVAALLWPLLRRLRARPGPTHYFVWLLFTLNVLTAAGYLLFSGLGGIGDWNAVVKDLHPYVAYRAALSLAGALLYFVVAPRLVMPDLLIYLGRDRALRERRARTYALLPYLVGGISAVLTGLLNPEGMMLVLISAAAASFGGSSLLAWYPGVPFAAGADRAPDQPAWIDRNVRWIAAGVIAFAIHFGVFGPGIRFGAP